jgi:hypothetical protein
LVLDCIACIACASRPPACPIPLFPHSPSSAVCAACTPSLTTSCCRPKLQPARVHCLPSCGVPSPCPEARVPHRSPCRRNTHQAIERRPPTVASLSSLPYTPPPDSLTATSARSLHCVHVTVAPALQPPSSIPLYGNHLSHDDHARCSVAYTLHNTLSCCYKAIIESHRRQPPWSPKTALVQRGNSEIKLPASVKRAKHLWGRRLLSFN